MESLTAAIACSRGSTPERWKKQACMMVLMQPPMPASRATLPALMTNSFACLFDELLLHRCREPRPDFFRRPGRVQQKSAARRQGRRHVQGFQEHAADGNR